MFTFIQYDSPLTLVIELALSVMIIAGIMLVARLVNSRSQPPPSGPHDPIGEKDK